MVGDLVARDTAGSESTAAGLKREHHEPSCWSCDGSDSLGVSIAFAVGKAMQAPAVDEEFMTIPDSEHLQAGDVTLHPVHADAARRRAAPGCIQRSRDAIDARDRPSAPSQVNGIATCPTADVQGPTRRRILFADFDKGRGNSVALPRRDAEPVQSTIGIHRQHGNRFMASARPPLVTSNGSFSTPAADVKERGFVAGTGEPWVGGDVLLAGSWLTNLLDHEACI